MESVNQVAVELVDEAIDFTDDLGIGVTQLDNEATVIDCGIRQSGGLEAGILFAEIQAGGLIVTRTRLDAIDGVPWTYIELECDHPEQLTSVIRPQRVLDTEGFSGVMSGPVQMLLKDTIPSIEEEFDFTVVSCYSKELPGEAAAEKIAAETGKPTSGVFFVVCPPESLSGRVAIATTTPSDVLSMLRTNTGGLHDLQAVTARAPIPPGSSSQSVIETSIAAMGLGGGVQVVVSGGLEQIQGIRSTKYSSWICDPTFGEVLGSENQLASEGKIPHSTIVGCDGDVVELGARNEELLRKKWIEQEE